MEDRWFHRLAKHSRYLKQQIENDLEAAMLVLRGGTQIERDEEERSSRAGTISWNERSEK